MHRYNFYDQTHSNFLDNTGILLLTRTEKIPLGDVQKYFKVEVLKSIPHGATVIRVPVGKEFQYACKMDGFSLLSGHVRPLDSSIIRVWRQFIDADFWKNEGYQNTGSGASTQNNSTGDYFKPISATKACPTSLNNGMCDLPNCSYSYPNDIYTKGEIVLGNALMRYGQPSGTFSDQCSPDGKSVSEMICGATSEGFYNWRAANFDCPKGC